MSSELIETRSIYEDDSGYKFRIYWDAVRDTYITGVTVNFDESPTNIEQLEIFIESEVQQYRNEIDYSKKMNSETEFHFQFEPPIQLTEDEYIKIDWQDRLKKNPCSVSLHTKR